MKGQQFDLWHKPSLDVTQRVKAALREVMSVCPLSREEIADSMSNAARKEGLATDRSPVSPDMLDKWAASSAVTHRMPHHFIVIFCSVTLSLLPIQAMLAPLKSAAVLARIWISWNSPELAFRRRSLPAKRKPSREGSRNENENQGGSALGVR